MPVEPGRPRRSPRQIALSLVRSRTGRRLLVAVVVLQLIALTVVLWLPAYLASVTATSAPAGVHHRARQLRGRDRAGHAEDRSAPPKVADLAPAQVTVARTIYLTTLGVGDRREVVDRPRPSVRCWWRWRRRCRSPSWARIAGIDRPNGDGDAGVFQQRRSPAGTAPWPRSRDVGYAARVFLRGKVVSAADVAAARRAGSGPAGPAGYTIPGLKQVRGWEDMAITVAAQKVQRSAFPDAYAKHERISRTLLAVFKDKIDPQSAEARSPGSRCCAARPTR